MEYLGLSLAILVLVLLSAFFSATETAYSSISKIKFKSLAESDNKKHRWAAALGDNYDKLLTTILIGNNIVNIAAATLATILFTKLVGNTLAGALSTIIVTIVVLFIGEVAPKTIAKRNPESMAVAAAPFVLILYYIFYPLNVVLNGWQKLVMKVFKGKQEQTQITDDELITYVEEAQNSGSIDEEEGELIRSAIEFDDLTVEDSLTPRVDLEALDINCSMEKALAKFRETGFSRLPVYKKNIDNIVGLLNEKDFYKAYLDGAKKIKDVMSKEIIMVPLSMKLSDLLKKLQGCKTHLAVVIGEYGGTSGIITLEDILEELVGEIWDEHDEIIERVQKINDEEYVVVGDLNLDELFDMFDVDEDTDELDSVTVSGLISSILERAPHVGDVVDFKNLKMTVLKEEFNRVLSAKIQVLEKEEEKEENSFLLRGLIGNSEDEEVED